MIAEIIIRDTNKIDRRYRAWKNPIFRVFLKEKEGYQWHANPRNPLKLVKGHLVRLLLDFKTIYLEEMELKKK